MSEDFKAEKIQGSGIYEIIHDEKVHHEYGMKIETTLDKGDDVPSCNYCNATIILKESKSYMDEAYTSL